MLDSHLIARTRPMAHRENVVYWKDYRLTVLQDRLFRLEKSKTKLFRDDATQAVWYRDMPKQAFKAFISADELIVQTKSVTFVVKPKRKDCYVEINGSKLPLTSSGNLKGTARTLDGADGRYFKDQEEKIVVLGDGVCSKTGVAILKDESSLTLDERGLVRLERGHGSDEYVFAYGDDYRGAVRALYEITGKPPLVPRFALGNWWSRYHAYTQEEYLRLLNGFSERSIPLTVATIDMDWHFSDDVDRQKQITKSGREKQGAYHEKSWQFGWTGYSWNTELFPDYKKLLKDIQARNLKITLNLHPADGVRFWEEQYEEMAQAMGVDSSAFEPVKFNFKDEKFINNYFKILHRPYEADGVDFWWIDWQQGGADEWGGIDPLWSLNHYHYLDNAADRVTPLILSRYSGLGAHRYPLGFSGDTHMTWETLAYLPYFTATATNVGYTWWSHDIGGHQQGEKSDELYVRHLQLGVLSPINRLHCSAWETMSKEPWYFQNGSGLIAEEWLRLRHKLIPFLYSCAYQTHKNGQALIEPLYYGWKEEGAYQAKTQYLFGLQMIVVPVVTKRKKDGYARIKAWLPQGVWTDIFTGDRYEIPKGGKSLVLLRTLDSVPVLIKAGGILPLSSSDGNSVENPEKLDVCLWCGDGEYTLYEDSRTKNKTQECFTVFKAVKTQTKGACMQSLRIRVHGKRSVIPKNRRLKILFKDVDEGSVSLFKNGQEGQFKNLSTQCLAIEFPFDKWAEYEIVVSYQERTPLERWKKRAIGVLLRAECESAIKKALYDEIKNLTSIEECKKAVDEAKIPLAVKMRLKETL